MYLKKIDNIGCGLQKVNTDLNKQDMSMSQEVHKQWVRSLDH